MFPWPFACAAVYLMTFIALAFLPIKCQGQDVKFAGCEIRLYTSLIISVSCILVKLERFFTIISEHGCFRRKTKGWETSLLFMLNGPDSSMPKERTSSFVFNYSPSVLTSTRCSKSQSQMSSHKTPKVI